MPKKKKVKVDELKSLSYKNQKDLYHRIVIEPVNKVLLEMNGNTSYTFCKEGVKNINNRLSELVKDVWEELYKAKRFLLPVECVMIKFEEAPDKDGVFDLRLSDSLISLFYGKLDQALVPVSVE